MKRYDLINYFDVWYNEEEGYTVNNCCVEKRDITITDDATAEDIIDYLKQNGYVKQNCTVDDFEVSMGDFIDVFEKETGKPLYSFRWSYDGGKRK